MAELAYELKKAQDEVTKKQLEYQLEQMKEQQKATMANLKQATLAAEEALRQAQDWIRMAQLDLTDAEQAYLAAATNWLTQAFSNYLDAQIALLNAEQALFMAEYEAENVYDIMGLFNEKDSGYYGGPYFDEIRTDMDWGEYYEWAQLYAEFMAAMYEVAKEEFEESDVAEWAQELEDLKDQLDEAKYSRQQVTKDSVYYMMNTFHDGVLAYGQTVEDWLAANNIRVWGTYYQYTQFKVGDYWYTANKPVGKDDKNFNPYNYYGNEVVWMEGDEEKGIPALKEDGSVAYQKFNYLLKDYTSKISEAGDGTKPFMVLNGTNLEINANQMMKEFILGGATETPFTYTNQDGSEVTAYYGLEGALSVLKRELVLGDDPEKTPEKLKEAAEKALKTWKEDREVLEKGLTNYAKYKTENDKLTTLKETLKQKKEDLKKAKEDAKTGEGSLVKASQELITTLDGIIKHPSISVPDSQAIVKAVAAYSKARKAYLDYTPYKNNPGVDSNLFYFARAITPKVIKDSIAFEDITYEMLADWNEGKIYFEYKGDGTPVTGKVPGVKNILEQLLGTPFSTAVEAESSVYLKDLNFDAFYNAYQIVEVDKDGKKVPFDDPASVGAKIVAGTAAIADGTEVPDYTPKAVQAAEAAVTKAESDVTKQEGEVKKAIKAYVQIYDKYWGTKLADVSSNIDAIFADVKKANPKESGAILTLDVARYTLDTFMKPYNAVLYNGTNLAYTKALGAILVSVDPKSNGAQNCFEGWAIKPQIFLGADGNTKTDFYYYTLAEYNYQMATAMTEEIIKAIEAWIKDVKAAFEKNAEYADASYKARLDNYDTYAENFKKLTGKDAKTAYDDAEEIFMTIDAPVDYYTDALEYTWLYTDPKIFVVECEWAMGGLQAEWAEKYLPGFPEKVANWMSTAAQTAHTIAHLEAIIDTMEDAYLAACEVYDFSAGYFTEIDGDYGYYEDYIDWFNSAINYYKAMAQTCADNLALWNSGLDPREINLQTLNNDVLKAELELEKAEIELERAQAYYESVITAIYGVE
ncbi:MAG: TolC family protein [Bacteroidales bacterium]|nr:TolC family protein [Bacteroidales bacterium]